MTAGQAGAIVGVDLDNTIIGYDRIMHRVAREWALIGDDIPPEKTAIRAAIRKLPDGEISWRKVQGAVYGPRIDGAELIDGVLPFFRGCRERGLKVHIVSHKTLHANYGDPDIDLREAAFAWIGRHGGFEPDGLGLHPSRISFTETRGEKLRRIAALGCRYFIDDLMEVFSHRDFPAGVQKLLFAPNGQAGAPDVKVFRRWRGIAAYLFEAPDGRHDP